MAKKISIIIPARNEAAILSQTAISVLRAVAQLEGVLPEDLHLASSSCEVIIVDDDSMDETPKLAECLASQYGVKVVCCSEHKAAVARNLGANEAIGNILVFLDADTLIPLEGLQRIDELVARESISTGFFAYRSLGGGLRAWFWWCFWNQVRRLPMARCKAMSACMFCTREAFSESGPFDDAVKVGEEWSVLAGNYRRHPKHFFYERKLKAATSSRRMEMQPFGYLRTALKYTWAILHTSGRKNYSDNHRKRSDKSYD